MKKWLYLFASFVVLILSWEEQLDAQAVIPKQSIRLRILANSDDPIDQWIKRKVRDAVIDKVNGMAETLAVENFNQAKETIRRHLPEIEGAVQDTLDRYGFSYSFDVFLGKVPFPSKVYGGHVYPAGTYEALRITLGKGEGQNWWCVLFPPLCFVDVTTEKLEQKAKAAEGNREAGGKGEEKPRVVYASFFWEWISKLLDWLFS
ncbi:stage II sporulation protein R [Thermicanus aegyptius]|uniref:stage II sporulation protein R n=1 Tax=Thermicanus aegyptius TaxID=94009 RepID=UPI000419CE3E|nr:stage II sporulation protein R [Thermicanus aegyptius]